MLGAQHFDAKGQRWTLFLGNAAQCALEETYDQGFFAVVQDSMPNITPAMMSDQAAMMAAARQVRVSRLRDIAFHGMVRHHPELTLDQLSDVIDDMGAAAFGEVVGKAIAAAQDRIGAEEDGAGAAPGKGGTRARKRTGTD